ncbi:MAG: DUF134 domain-containing protein [Lachnospiraceae bacterium]
MARPTKSRRICQMPETIEFVPCNEQKADAILLAVEEYEAIRLIDYLGLTQEDCAVQMHVARTTVQSIYDSARKKLADTLVNGRRLVIRGGCYDVCLNAAKCGGKNCSEQSCRKKRCEGNETQCQHCESPKNFSSL